MSILDQFKNEIDQIKKDVKRDVEVAILRESVRWYVARLTSLDDNPTNQSNYKIITNAIGTV